MGQYDKRGKRKPTNKDFVIVINNLIQDVHSLKNDMNAIMGTFDMYVEFENKENAFRQFMDEKLKIAKKGNDELQATGQDNTVTDKANSQN